MSRSFADPVKSRVLTDGLGLPQMRPGAGGGGQATQQAPLASSLLLFVGRSSSPVTRSLTTLKVEAERLGHGVELHREPRMQTAMWGSWVQSRGEAGSPTSLRPSVEPTWLPQCLLVDETFFLRAASIS